MKSEVVLKMHQQQVPPRQFLVKNIEASINEEEYKDATSL